MIRKVFSVMGLLLLAFLAYVAMQPREGRVTRSLAISKPAAEIFPHVNDFRKWQAWSPWARLDPAAKTTFEGEASGKGASFTWAGNAEAGKGRMTIVDSVPSERIAIRLDIEEPMAGQSMVDFTFKPEGDKTVVTWDMRADRPFLQRIMCTIFRADAMVGAQFEEGLQSLAKAAAAG